MNNVAENRLFEGYCYGPADIKDIVKEESTMVIRLKTSGGRKALAVYEGCVYWRIGENEMGMHISLVQQKKLEELLHTPDSPTLRELVRNSEDVESLLREWEAEGLNFYMHYGSIRGSEYLVAAKNLIYREF